MSAGFWFVAGLLAGVTGTMVAAPLWRSSGRLFARRPGRHALAGVAMVACFAVSAAVIYLFIGAGHRGTAAPHPVRDERDPGAQAQGGKAQSLEAAAAGLAARLASQGGSADDWRLLAQSYEVLGKPDEARQAREKAAGLATGDTPSGAGAAGSISGTVSISGRLVMQVEKSATLFIYAKAVDSPGPPLAVARVSIGSWPVSFRLDDSMAMLPSRRLSQFAKVVVEARISRTGEAAPASGDLYATSDVLRPGEARNVALVIDHQIG